MYFGDGSMLMCGLVMDHIMALLTIALYTCDMANQLWVLHITHEYKKSVLMIMHATTFAVNNIINSV